MWLSWWGLFFQFGTAVWGSCGIVDVDAGKLGSSMQQRTYIVDQY